MPPIQNTPSSPTPVRPDHMLPPAHKSSMGPFVGAIIVIIVLAFGALYFWGAYLNAKDSEPQNLPYIPADSA